MRHCFLITLGAVVGLGSAAAPAAVIVHQAEAFADSPTTFFQYAPVNFQLTGSVVAPSNTHTVMMGDPSPPAWNQYLGQTFHALDTIGDSTHSTYSLHADIIGSEFYGSLRASYPYVKDIYNDSADNFIIGNIKPIKTGLGTGPAPTYFGGGTSSLGIKVSNHSWVGTLNNAPDTPFPPYNANADEETIRRLDFMIDREDVILVAGAAFTNQNLVATSRNAVTVRGTQGLTIPASGPGKRHVDLWDNLQASEATAFVSGYAAALVGEAQATPALNAAQRTEVVRSLLLTGADKSPASGPGVPWTRDTVNNFDIDAGAGRPSYTASQSILQAGAKTSYAITGGTTILSPVVYSGTKGWIFDATAPSGEEAVLFTVPVGMQINQLTATLNWNVSLNQTLAQQLAGTIDTTDPSRIFADLDLDLVLLTPAGGGNYTIVTDFADAGLNSELVNGSIDPSSGVARYDNVEHLWYNSGTPLLAGTYAFRIQGDSLIASDYGFSYSMVFGAASAPVPEPTAAVLMFAAFAGLATRRGRRASR